MSQYRDLGIKADKLVLGLPWYGYDYPCLNINDTGLCLIKKVPFRGAACSDAAGTQIGYSRINDLLQSRTDTGRKWHKASQSPSFDYYDASDKRHQVWYDDPVSLTVKIEYAKDIGLKGAAIWNSDLLDYSRLKRSVAETKAMWEALALIKSKNV